jgi:sulfite exporter TauE/SafE
VSISFFWVGAVALAVGAGAVVFELVQYVVFHTIKSNRRSFFMIRSGQLIVVCGYLILQKSLTAEKLAITREPFLFHIQKNQP